MRAVTKVGPGAAVSRARRVWKDATADVYRAAVQRHGIASSWLRDVGGRPSRGIKTADQLARLVAEMTDAGFTLDQMDAALLALVRGIREVTTGTRPAA